MTDQEPDSAVDDAIVAGYERIPPTPTDEAEALALLRESILEEPW